MRVIIRNNSPGPVLVLRLFYLCLVVSVLAGVPSTAVSASSDTVTLGFTGDVMMAYESEAFVRDYGYHYPFLSIFPLLNSFTALCGNLECPVSDYGAAIQNKAFYFRMPDRAVQGLKFAGYDVMDLANNHMLDFGDLALFRTMKALTNRGIGFVGAGRNRKEANEMRVLEVNGLRVGYLAYCLIEPGYYFADDTSAGTATCDRASLVKAVARNRPGVDILVVLFHWGNEYSEIPTDQQTSLGRAAIDAGADLVIGHHPHVIQPVEKYKNGLIAYSLGNFAFGSYGKPPEHTADVGLIVSAAFQKKKLKEIRIYPVNVFNYEIKFQPCLFDPPRAGPVLKRFALLCSRFSNNMTFSSNFAVLGY